jgi:hypothetical protein
MRESKLFCVGFFSEIRNVVPNVKIAVSSSKQSSQHQAMIRGRAQRNGRW